MYLTVAALSINVQTLGLVFLLMYLLSVRWHFRLGGGCAGMVEGLPTFKKLEQNGKFDGEGRQDERESTVIWLAF